MKKNLSVILVSSFLFLQSVSFASDSKKITFKEKELLQTSFFTKDNLECYNQALKSVTVNGVNLCDIGSPSYFFYLANKVTSSLINEKTKLNYKDLEEYSGIKTFIKVADDKEMVNYYNPELIQWVFDNFYESPEIKVLGIKTTEYYDAIFKPVLREYARAYIGLQKNKLMEEGLKNLKDTLKKDTYSGADFVYDFSEKLKLDIKSEPRDYEDSFIIGFWLRRGLDNTDKICWKNLKKVMESYDAEWFKKVQE